MSTVAPAHTNGHSTTPSRKGGNTSHDDERFRQIRRGHCRKMIEDAYRQLGHNPDDHLPKEHYYMCDSLDFDDNQTSADPLQPQRDLHTWSQVHLANAKMKLIGKNGELDVLLAAMLTCNLIGLRGFSATGKSSSIRLKLESITGDPDSIAVIDCGTVYSKDQLIGHTDDNGEFVPGLINGQKRYIVLDEFSRMHGSLQSAVNMVLEEGIIRVDGQIHELHPDVKFFVAYNGLEDGGTYGVIQSILDRMQVVISFKHVDRLSTKVNGRLINADRDWQKTVGFPDERFRGSDLFDIFAETLEETNGKGHRERLIDLLSEAVTESQTGDLWAPGSQLSPRATAILGRVGNALMAIRGISPGDLTNNETLFGLAKEVLESTAYNQLEKNPLREETKDELFEEFLNSTFQKFLADEARIRTRRPSRRR